MEYITAGSTNIDNNKIYHTTKIDMARLTKINKTITQ